MTMLPIRMTAPRAARRFAPLVIAAAALSACVTAVEPDPRLVAARQGVARVETQAALAPEQAAAARAALARAEDAWRRQRLEEFDHEVRLTDGNVRLVDALVGVRRAQEALEQARTRRTAAEVALARKGALTAQAQAASARARAAAAEEQLATAQQQAASAQAEAETLREALNAYQPRETEAGTLVTLSGLMFATGSASLRPGAEQRLDPLARYLSRNGASRIRIEGHTDSVGAAAANLTLSKARADAVADYLSRNGVDRTLIETRGLGETKPIASNATASGREENRRVEVTILR